MADAPIGSVMYQEGTVENNTFVTFRNFSNLANNSAVIRNNRVDAYGGFGGFLLVGGNKEYTAHTAYIQNNYINDYRRRELLDYKTPFESVGTMRDGKSVLFTEYVSLRWKRNTGCQRVVLFQWNKQYGKSYDCR